MFTLLPPTALFIVLYFVGRWVVAARIRDAGGDFSTRTAREILDGRCARGEIESEDYQRMRSRLETP